MKHSQFQAIYLSCFYLVTCTTSGQMDDYFIFQVPYVHRGSLSVQLYTTSAPPVRVSVLSSPYPRKSLCSVTVAVSHAGQCTVKQTHRQNDTRHVWTLVMEADGQIGANIFTMSGVTLLDKLQLLPVSQFDKDYYVITTGWKPAVVIVAAHNDTKVSIRLVNPGLGSRPLHVYGNSYTNGDQMDVLLHREDGFILQRCDQKGADDFSGTSVYGDKPVGVITGTCGTLGPRPCSSPTYMTMLESYNQFGVQFIIVNLSSRNSEVIVMTTAESTRLNFTFEARKRSILIRIPGSKYKVNVTQVDSGFLVSDKPVACYQMYIRSCHEEGTAMYPWMVTVRPNALFHDLYIWNIRGLDNSSGQFQHYVTFILPTGHVDQLTLDGRFLSSSTVWGYVGQSRMWTTTRLSSIAVGTHQARTAAGAPFVCYVSTVHLVRSQLRDSDTHAIWSSWEDWTCQHPCGQSTFLRARTCDSGTEHNTSTPHCPGNRTETKPGQCVLHALCPEDCPNGTYGMDCVGDCHRCVTQCDKDNGSCSQCRPGWQGEEHGCSLACPKWTYGNSCASLCESKCAGQDCVEREEGKCPETTSVLPILVVLMIIPYLIFLIFFFARPQSRKRLKKKKVPEVPMTTKHLRKTSDGTPV